MDQKGALTKFFLHCMRIVRDSKSSLIKDMFRLNWKAVSEPIFERSGLSLIGYFTAYSDHGLMYWQFLMEGGMPAH
jgi:hypothetical protein